MSMHQHRNNCKSGATATPVKQHHFGTNGSCRTPSKSPISYTKCANQSNQKQNVSYGQLQIVLQNLQNIKQKASTQVKLLNQDNTTLKQQINQLKDMIQDLRTQVIEKEQNIRNIKEQCRQNVRVRDMEIRQKELQIKEKDKIICSYQKGQEVSVKIGEEYEKLKEKWKWAFNILCGDETRADQTIYKIKSQNCTIWDLLQKQKSTSSMYQLSKQKIESLTHELVEVKEEYKHTTQMLDKSLNELNVVTVKMTSLQEKVKEYSQFLVQAREQQLFMEKELEEGKNNKESLEANIINLEHTITLMKQEIELQKQNQAEKDKKVEYTKMVSQVCDETQDYSKVLERMRYLQRFRGEHFKNIEKIQHLCKLIDS